MPRLTPSAPGRQIYAFIGGAFRPPNHRHWQMISYFSDMVGNNGEVIVVVSNPKSSKYQKDENHAFEDGRTITTEEAVQVLEIFLEASRKNNITIMESEEPSPVRAIYGMVEDPDTMSDCDVLICCYKDEADFKKWDRLKDRVAENNPTVNVLDYRKYAFRRSYENFAHGVSQLQRRIGGTRLTNEEDAMPSFLSEEQLKQCMDIIYHGDYNPEKETAGPKQEKPEKNSQTNESTDDDSIEADYFESFDDYNEFVDCYKYGFKGHKVLSSEFDDGWGGLRIFVKDPDDGSIDEILVKNHNLKSPTEWYADCGVSEEGLFECVENSVIINYDKIDDFVDDWKGTSGVVSISCAKKQEDGSFMIGFNNGKQIYLCSIKNDCGTCEDLLSKIGFEYNSQENNEQVTLFDNPFEFVKFLMTELNGKIKSAGLSREEEKILVSITTDDGILNFCVEYQNPRDIDWIKSALHL